jgi:single-strand DNA-binding protein
MNKVILIGNLTADPELRTTPSGTPVCTFRLAVERRFTSKDGEKQTDFINVVAWRQLGEVCAKYLQKGRQAAVSGSLQIRQYEDKDGVKRTAAEVVAEDVQFLRDGSRSGGGERPPLPPEPAAHGDFAPFTDVDDDSLPF